MRSVWLWSLIGAIALAATAWFLLYTPPSGQEVDWHVAASDAIQIGTPEDPQSYEGAVVHDVSGSGSLVVASDETEIAISVDIGSTAWLSVLGVTQSAPQQLKIELVETTAAWPPGPVYGDTAYGGTVLPTTTALLGGEGMFEVSRTSVLKPLVVAGIWSLAYAVRRSDGSVRQQGLYYSPLLRDKSGFSDATRLEFTLILSLYHNQGTMGLTLVFRTIDVLKAPTAVTLP